MVHESIGIPTELVQCLTGEDFTKVRESMIINAAVQLMKAENKLSDLRISSRTTQSHMERPKTRCASLAQAFGGRILGISCDTPQCGLAGCFWFVVARHRGEAEASGHVRPSEAFKI